MNTLIHRLIRTVIRMYQIFVSPVLGQTCRFHPSCSQYALDAIEKHGVIYGSWLTVKRLVRCNPWHPGGYDPVPNTKKDEINARNH